MIHNKIMRLLAAAAIACSLMSIPASALEYNYTESLPKQQFFQATSVGPDAAADSGTIVVGEDGTIATDESNLPSSSPLSVLDLPVGEFPDAFGSATDVAIASNTIFPNAFAPSTQWSTVIGWAGYDESFPISGALPTGAQVNMAAIPAYTYAYSGITSVTPMPAITKGGAIGKISAPSAGISAYVYEGATTANMRKGVAHFDCTSGWNGNIALAGHNRGSYAYFLHLKDLNYGDPIYYTTAYGTRTYIVSSITTCATTDTSGLLQDGTNKLTMYTCKANQPDVKLKVVATLVA